MRTTTSAVTTLTRPVMRFGRAPKVTKNLRKSRETGLPQPHIKFVTREFAPCRIEDHYYTTLQDDLMYMTYKHESGPQAISNRSNLMGAMMALRALTGENEKGGGQHAVEGIQVVRGKKSVGGDLKGQSMYDFLATLTELFSPVCAISPASCFPPNAMGFFPQIEVNLDSYPKPYGMHIHFVTNAVGLGAQNRARALVSGFQIPFVRK
ncbi:hypothetical protein BD779DRAFT_1497499 [Infundibulicybe gibba]|nr:hypothetical protein BD779DRAFT_1497499 [Infundibulicybe gibba]